MTIGIKQMIAGAILLTLPFAGCKKDAGEGGKATIKGKVWVVNYNTTFEYVVSEYAAQAEDVYIVYGDNATYNDRVETHHDGTFEFNWLREGDYQIYLYSKDSTGTSGSGDVVVLRDVTISDNKENVDLGTLTILD